ncbi:hypothetical protein H6G63_07410 [Leptolyngbya sp. FACHB-402]|nr:hypothetical protein [Leptolyngbya sp. FACHB-239]MBD2404021.1 hypothetical protein [Leptolyngbya sp. FACHB-402]
MQHTSLEHEFVEQFPKTLQVGILYISMKYATAAHCCCCGCGEEVVTPFTPTDWKMTFDGETVSLSPSIGNWNFTCRSHYWIQSGRVIEAEIWTDQQISANRVQDKSAKADYYVRTEPNSSVQCTSKPSSQAKTAKLNSFLIERCLSVLRKFWRKLRYRARR